MSNDLTDEFRILLFDMDGVITSETEYWNCAALTVFEMFYQEDLNVDWCEKNAKTITNKIFDNGNVIRVLKDFGINTNWDLAFVVYCGALVLKNRGVSEEDLWSSLPEYFSNVDMPFPEMYDYISDVVCELYGYSLDYAKREGQLWMKMQDIFQQWYMGDKVYECVYGVKPEVLQGKTGFIYNEKPLLEIEELRKMFEYLTQKGIILGIGTGRSDFEILEPLKLWDLYKYFDKNRIITYTDIVNAQKNCSLNNLDVRLTKPHPYIFLKGAFGKDYDDVKIVNKEYDETVLTNVLAIGDAGADILSAQAAGIKFAAVLTGVSGKDAYDYFKNMNSDYIYDNVLELINNADLVTV